MTRKLTTDDGFGRPTLREAANLLTNGLVDRMRDILKQTERENLRGARECGETALDVMEAAAVLRTVHGYAYMTSRRLQQIASLMQLGEGAGNKPEYLELCDYEGPFCDCNAVCKHKPKHLRTGGEKALAEALQRSRQFFQNEPPNG